MGACVLCVKMCLSPGKMVGCVCVCHLACEQSDLCLCTRVCVLLLASSPSQLCVCVGVWVGAWGREARRSILFGPKKKKQEWQPGSPNPDHSSNGGGRWW